MGKDIKDFWRRFQSGVEIILTSRGHAPDKSLGVREGFLRYFHQVLDRDLPTAFRVEQLLDAHDTPMTDRATLSSAVELVKHGRELHPDALFIIGCEEGLSEIGADGEARHLVKSWAVIDAHLPSGRSERAWGSSAGFQIPQNLLDPSGHLGPSIFPSTRRGAGLVEAVTHGSESRRSHAAQATFGALCSLFYGRLAR